MEDAAHNSAHGTSQGSHFSCSLTAVLLARVQAFGGAEAVEEALQMAHSKRTLPYLLDTSNWVSYDETVALWEAGRRVTHNPQFARVVGEDAARRLNSSPVASLLRSMGSPEEVYRHLATASARFSTVSNLETVATGPGFAEILSLPLDGFPRHPDHCAWTCGLLTQPPVLFGFAPAIVEHEECMALGASGCRYRITWEEPGASSEHAEQIQALRDQLDAMHERLRSMFETASDLIGPGEIADILARITDRAAVEVRAPRYLLAVRTTPGGEVHCHHKGFDEHEVTVHVERILNNHPAALPDSWLVVPVRSHRRDYGRLLAMNDQGRSFFPQERELLEVYARYAASALDSATALMEAKQLREAELRSSERFVSAITDSMAEGMFALDGEGRVTYMNRAAGQLLGFSEEELAGRSMHEVTHCQHTDGSAFPVEDCPLTSVRAGGPAIRIDDDVFTRQNGALLPVAYSAAPLTAGASRGLVVVFHDVTVRREAEDAIRRHAEGQEEIANLGRLALGGASLEELFDRSVGIASRVLSADCAWLLEHLADTSSLVMRAAVGWPDERKGERIASEEAPTAGYAVRSRGSIVVEDWEDERRVARSSKLRARGVRSSVATLVGDPGSPFGALAVHYTQPQGAPPDCLPFLDALANVLAEAIQARHAQDMIRHQALHDGLTGLPNRTLFLDRVAVALARNERHPAPLAVLFIDLDHFKLINDTLGHGPGDELLRVVAARLASVIRRGDTLAHLGGDEFAVLSDQLPSEVAATRIANQLLTALEEPVALNGDHHLISASIGIAVSTSESSAAELLGDADAAVYQAKSAGRGRAELFDEQMHARVLGRVRTESALRAALAKEGEIYVHYQPLVSLRSGRIVGAEALARWRHPDWGPVSPVEFIPVAEESGLIHQLGAQVLRRVAHDCAAWQDVADFDGVAVNVSARQLVQSDEVPTLASAVIAAAGITPGFLTLEITESLLIEQLVSTQNALRSLRDLGVRLSLDDFGTGYSSLSQLTDLRLDSVKIDRSLIRNIVDTPQAAAVALAIVQMGHALNLEVIAEGIETQQQATRLHALGCDIAQGFYFAQPMAPEQLTALLQDQPDWMPRSAKRPLTSAATAPAR